MAVTQRQGRASSSVRMWGMSAVAGGVVGGAGARLLASASSIARRKAGSRFSEARRIISMIGSGVVGGGVIGAGVIGAGVIGAGVAGGGNHGFGGFSGKGGYWPLFAAHQSRHLSGLVVVNLPVVRWK